MVRSQQTAILCSQNVYHKTIKITMKLTIEGARNGLRLPSKRFRGMQPQIQTNGNH